MDMNAVMHAAEVGRQLHGAVVAVCPSVVGVVVPDTEDRSTWAAAFESDYSPTKAESRAIAGAIGSFVFAAPVQRDLLAEIDELKAQQRRTATDVSKVAQAAGVDITTAGKAVGSEAKSRG